jgi:hypothetical protein
VRKVANYTEDVRKMGNRRQEWPFRARDGEEDIDGHTNRISKPQKP